MSIQISSNSFQHYAEKVNCHLHIEGDLVCIWVNIYKIDLG